jgi:hypothetical protein
MDGAGEVALIGVVMSVVRKVGEKPAHAAGSRLLRGRQRRPVRRHTPAGVADGE